MVGTIDRHWPGAWPYARAGDLPGFARAIYGYFVGDRSTPLDARIRAYAACMRRHYIPPASAGSAVVGAVLLGLALAVAWLARRGLA
jgi:hypothetical protein